MGLIHVWRWKGSAGVRGREVALHLNNKWGNILNNEKQDDMNVSFTPLHLKARTVSVSDVLRTYDYYWSFAFTSHRTRDVLLQLKLHFTDEVCGQEAGGDLPKRWSCGRPWKCGCLSAIDFHKAIFGAQGFSSTNVHNSRNWTLRYQVLMIHEWLIQVDRSKQPQYFWQPVRTNMLATSCNIFSTKNKQWCTVMACFLSLCSDKVIGKNCRPCFTQGLGLAPGLCSLFGALHGTLLFETAVYSPWQFGWNSLLCLALLTWLCPAWRVSSDSHGVGAARRVVDTLVQFLCYEDSGRPRSSQRGCRCQVLQWSGAGCVGTGDGEADWHWRSIFHLGASSEGSCGVRDEGSWVEQQQWWRHARLGSPRRSGLHDRSGPH